jgi:hypothetical protein
MLRLVRGNTIREVSCVIDDGLDALRAEIGVGEIASLVERTARWVAPETFSYLPVWYPEHARKKPFYNANWSEPRINTNRVSKAKVHRFEGNTNANEALTKALGLRKKNRPNWSCCHLWGVDDVTFQASNDVVADHRFYSCIANMVLLPTPLKAFTDAMPEIKSMLRLCARNPYGWECNHETMEATNRALDEWSDWSAWPESWPRRGETKRPRGTTPFSGAIRADADRRLATIRRDLAEAGEFYPRDEVRDALNYWGISGASIDRIASIR